MIRVGKESKQNPTKVLERAVEFFGPEGLGLDFTQRDADSVHLQGGGGYVVVRAHRAPQSTLTTVDIESREWDRDAKRFLEEI